MDEDGDGIIVRVYESQGARVKAKLTFGFDIKDAIETNLMEVNETEIEVINNSIEFNIKPFEVKTFRIK